MPSCFLRYKVASWDGDILMKFKILLDTETQLEDAASPRLLCSGQRQRWTSKEI